MIDVNMLTAKDFIGVRADLVRELGDAGRAIVLSRIFFRMDERWEESHADDGHVWWRVTRDRLAEETGLSIDQVKRHVTWLVENGYVESRAFKHEGNWDQTRSLRVITDEEESSHRANSPDHSADSHNGRAEASPIGADPHYVIGAYSHYVPSIQKKKKDIDQFEEFWEVWPRKVGKPKALLAFQAALKNRRATAEQIIAAAVAFRDHPHRPQGQFVPYPTTWIHRDGWNDELPPAPQAPGPTRSPSGGPQLPAAPRYPIVKAPTDDWVMPFPEPVA